MPGDKVKGNLGLKPLILLCVTPIFIVASVIAVFFNYWMARDNDGKRINDHILQRRMDLVFLSNLPDLRIYLVDLHLGLDEEAAFVKEDVQGDLVRYFGGIQPSFPHRLSLITSQGKECIRLENGRIADIGKSSSSPGFPCVFSDVESGHAIPLPQPVGGVWDRTPVTDTYPVYDEINHKVLGALTYEYVLPVEMFYAHSRRVLGFNLLLSAGSLVLALLITWFILSIVTKPLIRLTAATKRMLKGDLGVTVDSSGPGETQILAETFESLWLQLQARIRQLQENAGRLEAIIDFLPDATLIIGKDRKVLFWNKALEAMTGVSRKEMLGKGDRDYAVPFYGERRNLLVDLAFDEALKGESKATGAELYIDLWERKSSLHGYAWARTVQGERRLLAGSASPLHEDDGTIWGAIESIRDITESYFIEREKEQLQAQLFQAQKMEAIGTLAGGIAHDFNNLLQAISGLTQLLMLEKRTDHPDHAKLTAITDATQKASTLIKQLLLFSRKLDSEIKPVDLNQEVRQTLRLLERTLPKMIEIEFLPGPDLHVLSADPIQIEQVLINLAINAGDAMPEGGKLIFRTRNVSFDEVVTDTIPEPDCRGYVLLSVEDTGSGMDEEVMRHIFEPFFTTKELGKGTGLGLAMSYGIMQNHGGWIHCDSKPGAGTVFSLYFPVTSDGETEKALAGEQESRPHVSGASILLVDDEETLLDVGREMLQYHGYRVTTAKSGEDALKLLTEDPGAFDLIILDLNMPGMGGEKCLKRILELDSKAKVLITSGYSAGGNARTTTDAGACGFLSKPYNFADLGEKIRSILASEDGES